MILFLFSLDFNNNIVDVSDQNTVTEFELYSTTFLSNLLLSKVICGATTLQ